MRPASPPASALHRSPCQPDQQPSAGETQRPRMVRPQGTPSLGGEAAKRGGILNRDC
jgi:hypothetical protein